MVTTNTSIWNAAWTGPVVCVLVMAVVFFALWWATRQLGTDGPSGEEVETFMTDAAKTDEFGTTDAYVIANHKAEPDRTVSRTATKDKDPANFATSARKFAISKNRCSTPNQAR